MHLNRCQSALVATLFLMGTASAVRAQETDLVVEPPVATAPSPNLSLPRLLFAGQPLPVPKPEVVPYRDPADNAVCVSPDSLGPLGIVYIVDEKMGKVTFTNAEGTAVATVTLRTPPEDYAQKGVFVPLEETVTQLGGKCQFEAATNTLYCRSVLTGVMWDNGKLIVQATLPLTAPKMFRLENGKKLVLDFVGAEVGGLAKVLTLDAPSIAQVRTGQFESDIARVVLDLKDGGTSFSLAETGSAAMMALNVSVPDKPRPVVAAARPRPTATAGKTPTTFVKEVTFRPLSEDRAQFIIRAGGVPITRAGLEKNRLTLDLLNATLSPEAGNGLSSAKHPFLNAVQLVTRGSNTAQLVLDLTRIVNFQVRPDGSGNVVLEIGLPRGAGGTLAGKLVVVDPGHGGSDAGAIGVNGTREKNVALAISLKLADLLRENGANVIMTRAGDFFIPVSDRPRIANRAGADFFIAVHADSGDSNHRICGSTVYYHGYDPHCRSLAQSISDRFSEMGGISSRGIRTDFVRFPGRPDGSTGGFGVLRGARMVAVLVETGYMSHAGDVRLLNQQGMQQRIATAIMNGLRDYIEGHPFLDTRATNPNVSSIAPPSPELSGGDSTSSEVTDTPGVVVSNEPDAFLMPLSK